MKIKKIYRMKYIKTFESENEDTNYGYKSMDHEGNIIIDLNKFNKYNSSYNINHKIYMLEKMLVGKIVGFRGRQGDNIFKDKKNDKKVIKKILYSLPSTRPTYIFYSDDNTKYTIDNGYPITIYTMETDTLKYNL